VTDYKVLLLGIGFWGTKWIETLGRADNCTVAGIAGSRQETVDKFSAEHGIVSDIGFTDYIDAIEKTDADIVIISIPTKFHVDAAKRSLARGMHVLSEKPLATSMDEVQDILEVRVQYPGLKYMVDQNYRWRPHNQTMKKAIDDGAIGEIGAVHVEFRQPEDLLGYRKFLEMPLLQDVSIHHFDLVRFFTGKNCKSIDARSFRPAWSKFEGKPATEAVLTMEDDIVVNYNGTWAARGKETSWDGTITVTGSEGCLVLDPDDNVRLFKPGDAEGALLDKVDMDLTEMDYALDMFIRAIEQDGTPEVAMEDNRHSFAMVCAAEESVAKNVPVDL
jgi:predicted dehydrogenase